MASLDFNRDVLERSHAVPVVVDFWAAWCGPCRVLGPTIEQLASEAAGRWELVKLNTEEHPELASEYGIMSIPAVKMFDRGKVVAEFVGALPAEEIRAWLADNLPDPRREQLEALGEPWQAGDAEVLKNELETFVERHPDYLPGRLRLAQAIVADEPQRARQLVGESGIDAASTELASDITSLAELMDRGEIPPRLAPHVEAARSSFRDRDLDQTLEHLVEAAMLDRRFADELARRAAVALFRMLGQDHELTRKHQRRLAMALHP